MLFNSLQFLLFFLTVLLAYFTVPHRYRWALLLGASYYFYMCWRPAYLILIVLSTAVDYVCALRMSQTNNPRAKLAYLITSLTSNLGLLFTFKYLNFFGWSVKWVLGYSATEAAAPILDVLLPVGISFYTFQTLSYTIDVYRGVAKPERHLGIFALYVAFFPQLVAGPIERSTRLMPQFHEPHKFNYAYVVSGAKLMLLGFFKKLVIADQLAVYVDTVYADPSQYHGLPIILATYFFAFQIYCDFSGYSDIAIGAARTMGFDLMENFRSPYFARSIGEFWRRWHISLSTWFKDYVYVPLGGTRVVLPRWCLNIMVVFVVSGLWHGANWTFIIWGLLHGLYMVIGRLTAPMRKQLVNLTGLSRVPIIHQAVSMVITFHLVLVAWVFFRANSVTDALLVFQNAVPTQWAQVFSGATLPSFNRAQLLISLITIGYLEVIHVVQLRYDAKYFFSRQPLAVRWAMYCTTALAIVFLGRFDRTAFIYFQF